MIDDCMHHWYNFRLQTELSHYQMLSEQAYVQLTEIRDKQVLSQSQAVRLCDWMELVEEVRTGLWQNSCHQRLFDSRDSALIRTKA